MKIPQILADGNVPASIPGSHTRANFDAPAAAAAQGFAHVSARLSQLQTVIAERDEALRNQEAKSDAALIEAQIEMGMTTLSSTLKTTVRDPGAHMQGWQDGSQQLVTDALKDVKNPETAVLVRQRLPAILQRYYAHEITQRDALVLQKSESNLTTTIETRRQIASTIPVDNVLGATENLDKTKAAIMTEAPIIGLAKAADKASQETKYQIQERAQRHVAANAADFLARVGTDPLYRQLDPLTRDGIITHAKTVTLAQAKDAQARQDKFQADLHAKLVQEQKYAELDLDRSAAAGTLTRQTLELSAEMRRIGDDAYRRLDTALKNPKQGPSDQATLTRYSIAAHRTVPTVSEADLSASYEAFQSGKPGLNHQDYVALADKVVSRKEALRAQALAVDSKDRADANHDHNQAEQILFKGLGIPTLYDKLDPLKEKLLDSGLRELTARSRAFKRADGAGGTENPIDVTTDILQRFQPLLAREAQMSYRQVEGTLIYKTPEALDAARGARRIAGAAYAEEKRKFIQLDKLRQANTAAIGEAAHKNTPTSPSPATTPEREVGEVSTP